MPDAPLRICATPRCPNRVPRGYCETCRSARGLQRRQHTATVPGLYGRQIDFYQSREWKALRAQVRREEPLCRNHASCYGLTEHVDHIIPREQGGPDERTNLQGLCISCHGAKTRREQLGSAIHAAPAKRYVICGPPGSGKTTWVQQRARPGDIVWDLDAVAMTLTQLPTWPRPPAVLDLLLAQRAALVQWLAAHPEMPAYLIVSDVHDARRLCQAIHADLVNKSSDVAGTADRQSHRNRANTSLQSVLK